MEGRLPISKQCLSRWLVETIQYAYSSQGLLVPQGIKAQLTQKQAASIAELAGATPSKTSTPAPFIGSTCSMLLPQLMLILAGEFYMLLVPPLHLQLLVASPSTISPNREVLSPTLSFHAVASPHAGE